ncbi:hypothetical protein CWI37_0551p0030 [Hamiltosporidium tvaerminnensis]|uniref:Uncharacterized protein n=1 Tax=Hamiltosporidium tvaerminnensis TaxID=1176355 RepID=A0A4Q9L3U3_9MICR|nr:hypothetical protein CWI37_0551p0030 [Hamiltosporidium tvaerminnensis]
MHLKLVTKVTFILFLKGAQLRGSMFYRRSLNQVKPYGFPPSDQFGNYLQNQFMSLASQYELPQTLANSLFAQLKPFKGLIDKIPTNQGIIEAEVVDSGVLDVLQAITDAVDQITEK